MTMKSLSNSKLIIPIVTILDSKYCSPVNKKDKSLHSLYTLVQNKTTRFNELFNNLFTQPKFEERSSVKMLSNPLACWCAHKFRDCEQIYKEPDFYSKRLLEGSKSRLKQNL